MFCCRTAPTTGAMSTRPQAESPSRHEARIAACAGVPGNTRRDDVRSATIVSGSTIPEVERPEWVLGCSHDRRGACLDGARGCDLETKGVWWATAIEAPDPPRWRGSTPELLGWTKGYGPVAGMT